MKKYGIFVCALVQLVYAPDPVQTSDIDEKQIKSELHALLQTCPALKPEPSVMTIVGVIECLCQKFPLKVIGDCKRVCAANVQLELDVQKVKEREQNSFLAFIKKYVEVRPTDGISQALRALKQPLATEGKYTRRTIYAARVCNAVMSAISMAAALKERDFAQLKTVIGQVGAKDKDYSSLYLVMLDAVPNPISVFMTQRTYDRIVGSLDRAKNPLSSYFGNAEKFFKEADRAMKKLQETGLAGEDLKSVVARKEQALVAMKDLDVPEQPGDVVIRGKK